MRNELDSIKIYEFVRDEIKREDANTQNRLSIALAFQGILMAATVLLLSGESWVADGFTNNAQASSFGIHLNSVRIILLYLLGAAGVLVAIISNSGVDAAQKSISATIDHWEKSKKSLPLPEHFEKLPRAYGDAQTHSQGTGFAYWLNRAFMAIWAIFLFSAFKNFGADFAGLIL